MEKLFSLIVIACISLVAISAATASDNQDLETQGRVEVIVKYDPLGPNNLIVAFVNFVNNNAYKVHVNWQPIIMCEDSGEKKGYGEPFDMSERESRQVTIWRSQACGDRKLKYIKVEMEVKKITDN